MPFRADFKKGSRFFDSKKCLNIFMDACGGGTAVVPGHQISYILWLFPRNFINNFCLTQLYRKLRSDFLLIFLFYSQQNILFFNLQVFCVSLVISGEIKEDKKETVLWYFIRRQLHAEFAIKNLFSCELWHWDQCSVYWSFSQVVIFLTCYTAPR